MTKWLVSTISLLIIVLLYISLSTSKIIIDSKAFGQLPVHNVKSSTSRIIISSVPSNANNTMTIHTTNLIQGNNFVIKQEELGIRKAILSNIDNAIFIAKGSVRSAIPVNVNAKIISQLNNDRVDTTQGIDMTKKLTATELTNAINATTPNLLSRFVHQQTRVVVDNQAICSGIASTKAACSFTINIHS
jgi:hypothetical protein